MAIAGTSPATAQNSIGGLLKQLTRQAPASGTPAGPTLATATPAQSAELERQLASPLQDGKAAADRVAALPVIRTMVATAACASMSEAWNARNRLMMRPQTFAGYLPAITPMLRTQYHDKRQCLDVVRIADWSKPAMNAVRFRVWFVAADSGEAANVAFELQRTSDGEWLVRDFGKLDG